MNAFHVPKRYLPLFSGFLVLASFGAAPASGGTVFAFESDSLGPLPVFPATIQSGWFTATVPSTTPALVGAYSALNFAGNPVGGAQALVMSNIPTGLAARAQHGFDFSQGTQWTAAYDVAVNNSSTSGNSFGTSYIGSFGVVSTTASNSAFTILHGWDNGTASSTWSAAYFVYDGAGISRSDSGVVPGPAWAGLSQKHWYNLSTVFDLPSNKIISVTITDLTTHATSTVTPTNWYMVGGATTTPFQGNAIRLSGFPSSNVLVADNVSLDAGSSQVAPTVTSVTGAGGPSTGLCPGCQATVTGTGLGGSPLVTVGAKNAYVLASFPGQLLIQIPIDAPLGPTTLKVGSSAPFSITLAAFAPGLPFNSDAGPNGAVANHVGSRQLVTSANPASPNEQIALTVFGLGPTKPVIATGVAPSDTSALTTTQPTVSVGGKAATVSSAFLTPGAIASYTVLFTVPADVVPGPNGISPLTVSIGGVPSNSRDLAVSTAPVISQVSNAASYTPAGLPNAPIAQGAIFVIKGNNLGPAAISIAPAAFQKTTLSGTSVKVTVGGVSVSPLMYYTSAGQIAALLPSNTPAGTGTISVTYNNQTGPTAPISVTPNNLGIFTVTSDGAGAGIVTYADYSLVSATKAANCGGVYTTCGAANPGDTLILWATGFGAVNGKDEDGVGLGVNQASVPLTVWLGGVQAPVLYQGRSGCCIGEDQIVFTVPAAVATGCAVPLVVQMGNLVSNSVVMPVAAPGSRTCTPANPVLSTATVQQLSGNSTLTFGTIELARKDNYPGFQDTLKASFGRATVTPATQAFAASYLDRLPSGTCMAFAANEPGLPQPFSGQTGFDAGAQVTITGPNGAKTISGGGGFYQGTLSGSGNYLVPGSYTVTAAGGADVKAFTTTVTLPQIPTMTAPAPDSVNPTAVTRSSGMTITWSGGSPNGYVQFGGSSATDNSFSAGASFLCSAPVTAGTFTVPPYVLLALPAGTFGGIRFQPNLSFNTPSTGFDVAFFGAQYEFFSPINFR